FECHYTEKRYGYQRVVHPVLPEHYHGRRVMSCCLPFIGFAGTVVQGGTAAIVPEMDIPDVPDHTIRSAVQGHLSEENGVQHTCQNRHIHHHCINSLNSNNGLYGL